MKALRHLSIQGNWILCLTGVLVLIVRAAQFFMASSASFYEEFAAPSGLSFADLYSLCNGSNMAAFIWIPLLSASIVRPATKISSAHFAVGSGSRLMAAARCLAFSMAVGTAFALVINVSAIPVIACAEKPAMVWEPLFLSTALQALVCSSAALVYLIALFAFDKSGLAFMSCMLYGMWDFMAQNVVGGGVLSIGWNHAIVSPSLGTADLVFRFSFLGSVLVALLIAAFVVIERKDYLPDKASAE